MYGNMVLQKALEEYILAGKRKRRMGIYLSDYDQDCLTNMRLADDVLLFAFSENSFKKCCMNSRGDLKKWVSGFIQERRKILATKA